MVEPLVPAQLAFDREGTPYSTQFADVYHSAAGGLGQSRHVFLGGNGLPARWQARRQFTVLETGFGIGLNFLATWQAWREDPGRCERLHFVAVEKHPFRAEDLAAAHAPHSGVAPLAAELRAAWPMLVPGWQRLAFEGGRVVLTLAFADIAEALPQMRLAADAIYLDGFAPARNPAMWAPAVLKRLARLAAPGATAATWSVAAEVRASLAAAGFAAEKRPGFGAKREMLAARIERTAPAPAAPAWSARRVMVIGAGIAGAAVSERFAARGWDTVLVERRAQAALEGSGNHAGTFHPLVTADDSLFARVTRAAFLHWFNRRDEIDAQAWARCGVLQLARDGREDEAQQRAIAALGCPPEYAVWLDAARASERAGVRLAGGGVWFAESGWMRPPATARAMLARCGARLTVRFDREVAGLAHEEGAWVARDARGAEIARGDVAVLANAHDALRLAPDAAVRLRRVRGQVSHLPGERFAALRAVLLRGGFILPPVDGIAVAGASFDFDDADGSLRVADHEGNLDRVERIVPGACAGIAPASLDGRVGWRAVVPDRLPMLGPIGTAAPGLYGAFAYGSRGLLWAGLGAELLASHAEGEPLPLEGKLVDALSPGRFARRALQRAGTLRSA
jgi:tRNA 5-methylaminomethyl-2-thiouridine biosynthesis bifunctional protein